jgi:hypothetical protein
MDTFGIGAAIAAMVDVYSMSSRHSGRTTALVESVKNGDRIYFLNSKEAQHVHRLCRERGVDVECVVAPIDNPLKNFNTSQGRAMFDHRWVEEYYKSVILRAQREIKQMEEMTSGYGAPHRETKRKAIELSKWQI